MRESVSASSVKAQRATKSSRNNSFQSHPRLKLRAFLNFPSLPELSKLTRPIFSAPC